MKRITQLLTAAAFVLVAATPVRAEDIVFGTLNASLDDGSLAGITFSVSFSYDQDQVAPVGESYVTLASFDFTLLDVQFTRDDIFQGGQVIFENGVPSNVTASFQVRLPEGSPVKNITFGFGSAGGIAYIDLDDQYGSGSFTFEADSLSPSR
jgi:hypothetical protein